MNIDTKSHLCMSCAYFSVNAQIRAGDLKSTAGNCLRHPPVTTMKQQGGNMAVATSFPIVNDHTWCGDHSDIEMERMKVQAAVTVAAARSAAAEGMGGVGGEA